MALLETCADNSLELSEPSREKLNTAEKKCGRRPARRKGKLKVELSDPQNENALKLIYDSTKNNPNPDPIRKPARIKHPISQNHSALEIVQAMLAAWTDRCKAAEVCRQLNISSMTVHQLQQRAM